jgi:hypothetical protein
MGFQQEGAPPYCSREVWQLSRTLDWSRTWSHSSVASMLTSLQSFFFPPPLWDYLKTELVARTVRNVSEELWRRVQEFASELKKTSGIILHAERNSVFVKTEAISCTAIESKTESVTNMFCLRLSYTQPVKLRKHLSCALTVHITPLKPYDYYITTCFNIIKIYFKPTACICVFPIILTINSDYQLIYLTDTQHNHNLPPYLLRPNLSIIPESHQEPLPSPTEWLICEPLLMPYHIATQFCWIHHCSLQNNIGIINKIKNSHCFPDQH